MRISLLFVGLALGVVIAVVTSVLAAPNTRTQYTKVMDGLIWCDSTTQSIGTSSTPLTSATDVRAVSLLRHPEGANQIWCRPAVAGAVAIDTGAEVSTVPFNGAVLDNPNEVNCIAETGATDLVVSIFKEAC